MKLTLDDLIVIQDRHVDLKNRRVWLYGDATNDGNTEIVSETAMRFSQNLHALDQINTKPIAIELCVPGGDQHFMLACYDAIRLCKSFVTIVGTGCVLSAGAFVMQAADLRVMRKECRFMMHYGTGDVDKDFADVNARYVSVLYGKILEKNKKFSFKRFSKMLRDSEHLSAQECLDYGLIDEVI